MEEKEKKGSSAVIWIIVIIVVIVAALLIWNFTRDKGSPTTATTTETEQAAVTIPDGWKGFTSSKYGISMSYPSDYTLTEGATGTIKLTKGSTEMIDMYVYAANGDAVGMMKSQESLFTDDAKGYMIMDEVIQTKVAGIAATTVNGKFGKNAGISQTHDGIIGGSCFLVQNDNQFVFDSYDNGDETAKKNFTEFLATISF